MTSCIYASKCFCQAKKGCRIQAWNVLMHCYCFVSVVYSGQSGSEISTLWWKHLYESHRWCCGKFWALARRLFCLWSYVDVVIFTICFLSVSAVQNWPGSRCKEDRETAWEADEINGLQRVPQWSHGNRLNESNELLRLDSCLLLNPTDNEEKRIHWRMEMKFGWCLLTVILRMLKIMLVWRASSNSILQKADFCVPVWRSDNVVMIKKSRVHMVCLLFNVWRKYVLTVTKSREYFLKQDLLNFLDYSKISVLEFVYLCMMYTEP